MRHDFDKRWRTTIITSLVLAVVMVVVFVLGRPSDEDIHRVLSGAGYTQVELTGFKFLGCAKEDSYRIGFLAIGSDGKPVSGLVCSTPFKGHTVRVD